MAFKILSRSIRTELIVLVLVAVLPALSIILSMSMDRSRDEIKHAYDRSLFAARVLAMQQEQIASDIRQLLTTISQSSVIQEGNPSACSRIFRDIVATNPMYQLLGLATREGIVYASSQPGSPFSVADRKYFKETMATRDFAVGEHVISRRAGTPTLHFAYPVLDKSGQVKAVLIATLNLDIYNHFVKELSSVDGYVMVIVDHKGVRLYRHPDADSDITGVGVIVSDTSLKNLTGPDDEGVYEGTGSDGTLRVYAFKRLRLSKDSPPYLSFLVGAGKEAILREANAVLHRNLFYLAIAAAFALLAAWYLGNFTIVNRLKALMAAADRLRHGDLEARTGLPYTTDTIGQLVRSFDEMSQALEDQHHERTRAEEERNALQRRLSEIIDFLPDPTLAIDQNKRIIVWNKAMEEMTGVPAAQMLGKGDYAYTVPFYGEPRPQLMDLFWEPEHEVAQKYPSLRKEDKHLVGEVFCPALYNGKGAHVWLKATPLLDSEGNLIGAIEAIRDTTERIQAEESLRDSQRRLSDIIDFLPDATLVVDRDGKVIAWNRAIEAMTGVKATEMLGRGNYEYALPFYGKRRPILIDLALHSDPEQETHYTDIRRMGEILFGEARTPNLPPGDVHLSATASVLRDSRGEIIAAIECIRDITERKRYEEESLRNEARLRSLVNILQYQTKSVQEFLDHALDAALRLTESRIGYIYHFDEDRREFILNTWSKEVMKECSIAEPQTVYKLEKTGIWGEAVRQRRPILINDFRAPHPLKKGYPEGHAELNRFLTVPVISGDRVVAVVGVANKEVDYGDTDALQLTLLMDVVWKEVVRKQAEEALRESEERLRVLFESIDDFVFIKDLNRRYILINDFLTKRFGVDRSEILGKTDAELTLYDNKTVTLGVVRDTDSRVIAGESVECELTHLIRETPMTVSILKTPIRDDRGTVIGICGVSRDITEHRKAEEERRLLEERLQRSEKMESLGMLAGGVAHDLNNVLGILVGYAELMGAEIDAQSPLRSHVEYIRQGGERAAAIVHDLLTMARRGVQTQDVVNLNTMIAKCLQTPEFEKLRSFHPRVRIRTDLEEGLLNIKGSPVHLTKTLMNLVSNAAEAMPAGGMLTITTSNRYLDRPIAGYDAVREGDYAVLSVTDTGEGISAADMKRIFEPFYTKKVMGRSGTGLGLAVVWGTVKDHNGYIDLKSVPDRGTSFSLYFPVSREEVSQEHRSVPISEYMGQGESILVVDDVKGQRDLASQMLSRLNYSVATASGGEQAVEYLKSHQADLVVLDMIMDPGIDGLETFKRIREIHPGQKAIIVSGFSETGRVRQAQELGAGAYVRKPYVQEQIGLAIRRELGRA